MTYDIHPVANIFPMIQGQEFADLQEDIRVNGQHEPIWLHPDGRIIDGRNRYKACCQLGISPKTQVWDARGSLVAFVVSLNLKRRHLSSSQLGAIALDVEKQLADEAKARQREHGNTAPGRTKEETLPQKFGEVFDKHENEASAQAARLLGTNRQYVSDAKKLAQSAPELLEATKNGLLTMQNAKTVSALPKATQQEVLQRLETAQTQMVKDKPTNIIREVQREAIKAHLEDVTTKTVKAAQGVYDVIVIDPPWPIMKIERDERPNQSEFDYPVMTLEQIAALPLPMAEACHVWLWTTEKFLPMSFDLLKGWGVTYICTFVWHKPGGFQPYGLPQFNCEFAIYGRRGAATFLDTKALPTCFTAQRGEHSEKPQAFYDTVLRVTAGRRLDMFNRREIAGFDGWGKESPCQG